MFDIASTELLVIAVVALIIIGPKDLPKVMRTVGNWMAQARGMARHFRTGMDAMMREAELEEMEKKWKAENERIMREHPRTPDMDSDWEKAAPPPRPAPDTSPEPTSGAPADEPPPAAEPGSGRP